MENMKEDFFNLMFEKMEDSDSFDMEDTKLSIYRKEHANITEKLYQFIEQKIQPEIKEPLMQLIDKRNSTTSDYHFRENLLYYKNGFLEGMYVIISMFLSKKDQKELE